MAADCLHGARRDRNVKLSSLALLQICRSLVCVQTKSKVNTQVMRGAAKSAGRQRFSVPVPGQSNQALHTGLVFLVNAAFLYMTSSKIVLLTIKSVAPILSKTPRKDQKIMKQNFFFLTFWRPTPPVWNWMVHRAVVMVMHQFMFVRADLLGKMFYKTFPVHFTAFTSALLHRFDCRTIAVYKEAFFHQQIHSIPCSEGG